MQDILPFLVVFAKWCLANWPILAAVFAAGLTWKLYGDWKKQRASQRMPGSGTPEYCACGLPRGHWGKHLG